MSLETIITQFGYPALVVGLLLEGETVLVLGAFMAHRGYLSLPAVLLIGFAVTYASDQFFFWLGRTHGKQFIQRMPTWQASVEKAKPLLHRNRMLLFLGYRFMYGLRTVMPFVFGLSHFNPRRFALLSFIGTCIWVLIFGIGGYAFGQAMEILLEDVSKYEPWIALGIVVVGVSVWLFQRNLSKKRKGG